MNIDLFHTGHNEAGLICNGSFKSPVVGIILDAQTQELTLEFADGDTFHLNIPIEIPNRDKLLFAHRMYVGFLEHGLLTDSFEVPLLYLNDPYGSDFGQASPLAKAKRSVIAFEQFMKRCNFAQALHRDNLGDEDSARSILRGIDPHALQYSPALMRQMNITVAPKTANAPQMAGLGSSAATQSRATKKKTEDDK